MNGKRHLYGSWDRMLILFFQWSVPCIKSKAQKYDKRFHKSDPVLKNIIGLTFFKTMN